MLPSRKVSTGNSKDQSHGRVCPIALQYQGLEFSFAPTLSRQIQYRLIHSTDVFQKPWEYKAKLCAVDGMAISVGAQLSCPVQVLFLFYPACSVLQEQYREGTADNATGTTSRRIYNTPWLLQALISPGRWSGRVPVQGAIGETAISPPCWHRATPPVPHRFQTECRFARSAHGRRRAGLELHRTLPTMLVVKAGLRLH